MSTVRCWLTACCVRSKCAAICPAGNSAYWRFYAEHGLEAAKSYGRKYVEFASPSGQIKLALYGRRVLAKDAGVSPEGSGSHRIAIRSDAGPFTDPDGFAWETA